MFAALEEELAARIDRFSQRVLTAQVEVILNYADRFYNRQFVTREREAHEVLTRLERLLDARCSDARLREQGLPTVAEVAGALHLTPNYLGTLLRTLTGRSTQQHIHDALIARAKHKLSTSGRSVGEVAYELGFEYPQSFSKLFKAKTALTPTGFRRAVRG